MDIYGQAFTFNLGTLLGKFLGIESFKLVIFRERQKGVKIALRKIQISRPNRNINGRYLHHLKAECLLIPLIYDTY